MVEGKYFIDHTDILEKILQQGLVRVVTVEVEIHVFILLVLLQHCSLLLDGLQSLLDGEEGMFIADEVNVIELPFKDDV
jgi:hypothetical protein